MLISHQKYKSFVEMASKPSLKNSVPSDSESSPKKRKMLPMSFLKCFLCNKIIKIDILSEHLLFGGVHCIKCSAVIHDCQYFQVWKGEEKLGNNPCEHVLKYTVDPMQSLEMHLSNQYLENGTSCRASLIDKPHHLRAYVNGMDSVKNEFPWREAVLCFKLGSKKPKENILKMVKEANNISKCSTDDSSDDSHTVSSSMKYSSLGLLHLKNGLHGRENSDGKSHISVNKELDPSTISSDEQCQSGSSMQSSNSSVIYSPNKKAYGNVELPDKKKKNDTKKRRKTEWISGFSRKRTHVPKTYPCVSYVETPLNGFYYVVRHAVPECPNCYAKISPPDFTVNIVTFLMTAVCADCGLTIYIVHDPPDDSSPRVCIVTDEEKRRKRNSQKNPKQAAVAES